jgi:hypothetical protein
VPLTSAGLLQDTLAATSRTGGDSPADFLSRAYEFVEPYQFFILLIIVLWLVARRPPPKKEDFSKQAQEVLDEKFRNGEITRQAYEKYRQDISLRPKR